MPLLLLPRSLSCRGCAVDPTHVVRMLWTSPRQDATLIKLPHDAEFDDCLVSLPLLSSRYLHFILASVLSFFHYQPSIIPFACWLSNFRFSASHRIYILSTPATVFACPLAKLTLALFTS
jgi:hypothetical protein